jgi:hypothetical protein
MEELIVAFLLTALAVAIGIVAAGYIAGWLTPSANSPVAA